MYLLRNMDSIIPKVLSKLALSVPEIAKRKENCEAGISYGISYVF